MKELHPAVIIGSIVVVLIILGFFGYRAMSSPPGGAYHGGPINMGAMMKGAGNGAGNTGAPPVRHGPPPGVPVPGGGQPR